MEKLPLFEATRSMTPSRSSTQLSPSGGMAPEKLSQMLHKALSTSPDFGKVTPHQVAALLEYLGSLDPATAQRMLNLPDGIQTRTKFIPSIADFVALKNELAVRDAAYLPAPTTYKKLAPDPDLVQPPVNERKRQVIDALGYDPMRQRGFNRGTDMAFKPRPMEEIIEEGRNGGPPSDEIKKLLKRQMSQGL